MFGYRVTLCTMYVYYILDVRVTYNIIYANDLPSAKMSNVTNFDRTHFLYISCTPIKSNKSAVNAARINHDKMNIYQKHDTHTHR